MQSPKSRSLPAGAGTQPSPTVWRMEAEAMADVARTMARHADLLPAESTLRDELVEEGNVWALQARLRGLPCDPVE